MRVADHLSALSPTRLSGAILAALLSCSVLAACSVGNAPSVAPSEVQATSYEQYDRLLGDWSVKYVECARRYGAEAKIKPNGGIEGVTAEGRPTDRGFDAECIKGLGYPPKGPELTVAFLRGVYVLLNEQAQCLRAKGFSVSQPPSRDVWVENYGIESWNPLKDVDDSGQDFDRALKVCPQPAPRDAERVGNEQR